MTTERDLEVIEEQDPIEIWGEDLDDLEHIKSYKGKFVVTDDGKFFAKIVPKRDWDNVDLFHDMVLKDLGVKDAESMDIKDIITGGGKIETELIDDDHLECRLYGTSTIYGDYDPESIDIFALETEIRDVFEVEDMPVLIIPDYEE